MSDAGAAEKWHRKFAIDGNNRGWTLAEQAVRTAAEDIEMLDAAHTASFHWRRIGAETEAARADLLVAMVHALLGAGATALPAARRAFASVESRVSPDWEVALAHAVLALAASAAGDRDLHAAHHAEAKARGAALPDPDDRLVFEATFRQVPLPA